MVNNNYGRINFMSLPNTRDLGGLKTKEGRRIKEKKLLRSGALFEADHQDIEKLSSDYSLSKVIDLRTVEERFQKPDPIGLFSRLTYSSIPLIDGATLGITRERKEKSTESMFEFMKDPIAEMERVYVKVVLSDSGKQGLGRFFDELLEPGDGAVLWHCSLGKDRVGISTALLLYSLEVPEQSIVEDYLATNNFTKSFTEDTEKKLGEIDADPALVEAIRILNSARAGFLTATVEAIELHHGSLDAYLSEALGVDSEKKEALQEKFLRD